MSKVTTLWMVRDPSSVSILTDILWLQDMSRIDAYVLGSSPGYAEENHCFYLDEAEARADAMARLERVRSPSRGSVRRSDGKVVTVSIPDDEPD